MLLSVAEVRLQWDHAVPLRPIELQGLSGLANPTGVSAQLIKNLLTTNKQDIPVWEYPVFLFFQ